MYAVQSFHPGQFKEIMKLKSIVSPCKRLTSAVFIHTQDVCMTLSQLPVFVMQFHSELLKNMSLTNTLHFVINNKNKAN